MLTGYFCAPRTASGIRHLQRRTPPIAEAMGLRSGSREEAVLARSRFVDVSRADDESIHLSIR